MFHLVSLPQKKREPMSVIGIAVLSLLLLWKAFELLLQIIFQILSIACWGISKPEPFGVVCLCLFHATHIDIRNLVLISRSALARWYFLFHTSAAHTIGLRTLTSLTSSCCKIEVFYHVYIFSIGGCKKIAKFSTKFLNFRHKNIGLHYDIRHKPN